MREASRRGPLRDRVLERSARRVSARRSVALHCGEGRGVGWAYPWIPFGSEGEGMRRDESSPGRFHEFMTKVCHYAPSSEGALRRWGGGGLDGGGVVSNLDSSWIGARALWLMLFLGGTKGRYLRTLRGLGTGYPDGAVKGGGPEANRGITTPRYTLTPD